MRLLTYKGEAPTTLGPPNVTELLKLFHQQNELLKAAFATVMLVPPGTSMSVEDVSL